MSANDMIPAEAGIYIWTTGISLCVFRRSVKWACISGKDY